jgi:GNAT superfamily N-acetyltransferase
MRLEDIKIVDYHADYASYFYDFNIEWLETFFYVEPYDAEVLSNPQSYIIDKGGHVFFAKSKNNIVGTVALIAVHDGVYELSKMAVAPDYRGKKIGHELMHYCISFAKINNFNTLILYSNTKLENAIHIYKKYGFVEIPLEESVYKRSDIKMKLKISAS